MCVLYEILAPLLERIRRLPSPVDSIDVLTELFSGCGNRVTRIDERFPCALQVRGVGLLDQVDHVVEAVTFEAHTPHPESELSSPLLRGESGKPFFSR